MCYFMKAPKNSRFSADIQNHAANFWSALLHLVQDKVSRQALLCLVVGGHIVGQDVAVVVLFKPMAAKVKDTVDP